MATDVELSLKHTIMDQSLKDSAACNSSKKVKRIFDFFSSTPRTSASGVLKEVEVTEHAEKTFHPHEVHCEKESKSSFENDRAGTAGNTFQNTETCVAGDSKRSLNALMDVLPVESEPNVPGPAESGNLQKPTVMKRKRLATNNKAKGQIGNGESGPEKEQKRRLATNKKAKGKLENNEARAEKEQKGEPENDLLKKIPQEIDYEVFMKTFAQTPCLNKNSTTAGDEKREEPTDLAGAAVDFTRNRTEEKAAETELAVNKKQTEDYPSTSPILESGCHVGEPGLAKPKESNTANAFSLLMQAKTDRKKEGSSESGCHCIKAKDTPNPKQSFVRDISFTDHDDEGDSDQPDEVPLEKVSCSSGSSCTPSVLNFFSKCAKGKKIERDGRSVLVKVDIHCDPEKRQIASHKGKSNRDQKIKVGKVGTTDNDSEIVFLGSETIEINEFEEKKLKLRKSKGSSSACIVLSQETFDGVIKKKTNKSEQSVDAARRKKFLQDSTPPPDKLVKKAQATLQFAESGGLAMNTSVIAKPAKKYGKKDKEAVDSLEIAHLVNSKKSKTRNGSKRQRMSPACDSDSEDVQLVNIEKGGKSSTEETASAVKPTGKKMLTRLRKSQESESGTAESDTKDFTPRSKRVRLNASASKSRAQELLQKAKQQKSKRSKKKRPQTRMTERNTSNGRSKTHKPERRPPPRAARGQPEEDLIVEAESSTPEQGSRRQSRRLVEQQKMRQEAEQQSCISVDSDSCSDEGQTPQKKRSAKRRDSSQALPKRVSSRQNSKHPVGKLAPIFAKKKPEEPLNNAPEQPSEDPEVTRKRREFLMSGVPSELKRQAACAAPAVIATDYAPFPDISHVQQRSSVESGGLDMWSLAAPKNIRGILEEKDKLPEMAALDLKWTSLQWQPTVVEHNKSSLQLLDPPSSDDIDAEVCETLLKGLQQTNPTFPFAAMHSKFKAQLSGSTPKNSSLPDDSATVNSAAGTDSDVVIIDDLADTMSQNDKDSQWPEMLQPKSSSEMIGNESSIRRLKYWLEEWKALIQREARLSARSAAVGSDSDFDFSGDDSSEDCSQLCNTMLLVGPHGVGKTAAVYTLAHQLSYKVFEVNASSSRQGRHILAQLQEATQSHQVAQKKDGIIFSPSSLTPSRQKSQLTEQPDAKKAAKKGSSAVPNAFASFFKKADTATGGRKSASNSSTKEDSRKNGDSPKKNRDSPKKDSRKNRDSPKKDSAKKNIDSPKNKSSRKRRKAADEAEGCRQKRWCGEAQKDNCHTPPGEGEESNLAGYLNLSSTSLILFDEVDLVFEEDSGFLHTVQHFINTTKIPIIMTTSDPGFQFQINARFEALVFKAPSVVSVTSLLQTVCLAAGMRACPDDIGCLAAQCRGDIRHALLTLQFLTLSGGGWNKEPHPVIIGPTQKAVGSEKKPHKGRESLATKSSGLSAAGDENDSDGDFMSLKPLRKKARRIVDDDDDDAEDGSSAVASVSAGANTASESERQDGVVVSADRLPLVHLHLHESLLSVSRDLHALFIKCMKGEYNSPAIQLLTTECLKLKNSSLDLLQPNLLKLLPLPKTAMPGRWRPPSEVSSKSVKRKRIRSDIYDSEASDDENTKLTEASECPSADTSNKETAVVTKCDTDAGGEESSAPAEVQQDYAEMLQDESRVETSEANSGLDADVVIVTESGEEKGGKTAATAFAEKSCGKEALEANTSLNSAGSSKMDRTEESRVETSEPSRTVQGQMKKSLKGSRKCTDGGLGSKILRSFADYYETLSAVDSSLNNHQQPPLAARIGSGWSLLPGIEDAVSREECKSDQLREEMKAELGVCASRCLWQSVDHQISSWKCTNGSDQLPDGCSIPVSSSDTSTRLDLSSEAVASSASESYTAVADTIMNILPLTSYTAHGPLTLDYLPTLRAISQAEQCRQLAKVKRRFHHHFDNIGLCLSNSTVTALCAEFPPTQQNA